MIILNFVVFMRFVNFFTYIDFLIILKNHLQMIFKTINSSDNNCVLDFRQDLRIILENDIYNDVFNFLD